MTFTGLHGKPSGLVLEDHELLRCRLFGCGNSLEGIDPGRRPIIRRIRATKLRVEQCWPHGMALEDSEIDGLETVGGPLNLAGCVFSHVTLRGRVGSIMIPPTLFIQDQALDRRWSEANRMYYETVDWALDIRDVEAKDISLVGVPARLVRRDPSDQVIVRREMAQAGAWRSLDLSGTYWPFSLNNLARGPFPDRVLVPGRRDKNYKRLRDALLLLRENGMAE